MQQSIVGGLCVSVRNLLLLRRTCSEIEISEDRRSTLRPRIAAIVVTQPQSQSQVLASLPRIFDDQSEGACSSIPVPQLRGSGLRVVHDAALVRGSILCKLQQVVKG